MFKSVLFVLGLVLVLGGVSAAVFASTRSIPRQAAVAGIALIKGTPVSGATPTPASLATPTAPPTSVPATVTAIPPTPVPTLAPTGTPVPSDTPTPTATSSQIGLKPVLPAKLDQKATLRMLPPATTATPAVTESVSVDWPRHMNKGDSASLDIVLARYRASATPAPGTSALPGTPPSLPDATPGPIEYAYGSGHNADAWPQPDAPAFSCDTCGQPMWQRLGVPKLMWSWAVQAKDTGHEQFKVSMHFRWIPTQAGNSPHSYDAYYTTLPVSVTQPLIEIGQINLLAILGTVVGSGLSIPWLFDRYKARKEDKQAATAKGKKAARKEPKT